MTRIRPYTDADFEAVRRLHAASGLPDACMPPLTSQLFRVKMCAENSHGISQFGAIRLTGEAFVLVDHEAGTPKERWMTLQRLAASALAEAAALGLEQVTAWLPPEADGFGRRLEALGAVKSRWQSWTFNLT